MNVLHKGFSSSFPTLAFNTTQIGGATQTVPNGHENDSDACKKIYLPIFRDTEVWHDDDEDASNKNNGFSRHANF